MKILIQGCITSLHGDHVFCNSREKQRFTAGKPATANQKEPGSRTTDRKGSRNRTAKITVIWHGTITTVIAK
ncbi:MAG: hypothetical protein IH598_07245 [Bacteroidales bacterium]|nr:hypothetical protein [Bacteroidales bacterium]